MSVARSKEAQAASAKRHYETNKDVMKQRATAAKSAQRLKLLSVTWKAKDVPCTDCGIKYAPYVMDFDHVRGIKSYNVSSMVNKGVSVKNIEAEISKCEVVCSNCHRERTYKRREYTD